MKMFLTLREHSTDLQNDQYILVWFSYLVELINEQQWVRVFSLFPVKLELKPGYTDRKMRKK